MTTGRRKAAFVLAATDQGTMIVNRFDHHTLPENGETIGIGHHLLDACACDPDEVGVEVELLRLARRYRGDGVVAADCGANIGVHTVEWARAMTGWGEVEAFEAQERLFYALAGNIALNNCLNARARHAAVGAASGRLRVPVPDYLRPGSFGSLEMRPSPENEFIGQAVDYGEAGTAEIAMVALDGLPWRRLDFLKIDVEGMELEVLEGARGAIERWRPLLVAESLKDRAGRLRPWLEERGYKVWGMGPNLAAVHKGDPAVTQIRGE